jgi:hypothetical protein
MVGREGLRMRLLKIFALLGVFILVSILSSCCKPPTYGTLEYAVINADIIAHGVITKREYKELKDYLVTTNTIYTLSLDKVIKGNTNKKEILIKREGGVLPNGGTMEPFDSSDYGYDLFEEVLGCFQIADNTYYCHAIRGGMWMKSDEKFMSKPTSLEERTGQILKIMYVNDLPISLPKSEWPSYPTGPFLFPWQK